MKAGGFGMLSLTGSALKKGITQGLEKADANADQRVDAGEFSTAIRSMASGKKLPSWAELDPNGAGSLSRDGVAELVKAVAKQKGGALGGMIDADGVAKIIVAMADDDGDDQVSQGEFETLASDVAQ